MVANVSSIAAAWDAGQYRIAGFRKTPTQASTAGVWFDLSMSPGNPIPNYYAAAPTVAVALARSTDVGLDHGQNVSPSTKYLQRLMVQQVAATAAVPLPMVLCDYLMYYPFVDMSLTDAQTMTTNITIPRYTTGAGVQIMAVVVAPPVGSGASFQVQYTNSSGVSGRVTPLISCNNTALVNGSLVTSQTALSGVPGPFLPLQGSDTGVKLIESITFVGTDVGLLSFVLVKPLANIHLYDITAPAEVDFLIDQSIVPIIKDDAYLNFVCFPNGSLSGGVFVGTIETYWA